MKFTYRELEEITDVAYTRLKLWKSRGYFGEEGELELDEPVEFNDRVVTTIMWLSHLQSFNIELGTAFQLLAEAARDGHTDVLVITPDGHSWVSETHKLFEDHPAYLAVSMRHFMGMVNTKVRAFNRVKKMRNEIGLPTDNAGEPMSLVH